MKLTQYTVELNKDKNPVLVKESGRYYSEVDRMDAPGKIVDTINWLFHASDKAEEYVWLIGLKADNTPVGFFELAHGTVNSSMISPREIFIRLCLCGAANFVLVHNHPSGSVVPSVEDTEVTKRIKETSNLMNFTFLDHIIIGEGCFYSFAENNL